MGAWHGLSQHRPEAIQVLRMTASSLAAFALATFLHLPQGFRAVITALIVTQANVGGSLKVAFDRFIGSMCGAIYGGAVAFAIPHPDGMTRAVALVSQRGRRRPWPRPCWQPGRPSAAKSPPAPTVSSASREHHQGRRMRSGGLNLAC